MLQNVLAFAAKESTLASFWYCLDSCFFLVVFSFGLTQRDAFVLDHLRHQISDGLSNLCHAVYIIGIRLDFRL